MTTTQSTTAIYARVSTTDQNPETQLRELRAFTKSRKLSPVLEFVDTISGATKNRPQLDELMDEARKGKIKQVIVWKFDRFARSLAHLVNTLEEFHSLGIEFVSYTESIDTRTPTGKLFFGMVANFAEFERNVIQERIKAGIARARAEGKHLGRPQEIAKETKAQVFKLHKKGLSQRAIAKQLNLPAGTVSVYISRSKKQKPVKK
jgi:DNA invertase Pin-like site-specific DNA recombinase